MPFTSILFHKIGDLIVDSDSLRTPPFSWRSLAFLRHRLCPNDKQDGFLVVLTTFHAYFLQKSEKEELLTKS